MNGLPTIPGLAGGAVPDAAGAGLLTAALAFAAMPLWLSVLRKQAAFDVPNARSSHVAPTLRGGGAPLLVVLAAVSLLVGAGRFGTVVVIAAVALAWLGYVDDRCGLPAAHRLAAQLVIAASAGIGAALLLRSWDAALLAAVLPVAVNAFNFMDGVNGMAGGQALVGGAALWGMTSQAGAHGAAVVAACTAGAGIAFLPYNVPRARVFLGDVGSYGLGALLGGVALAAFLADVPAVLVLAPFLVFGVDVARTLLVRWARGEDLTAAHRDHVYQLLVAAGTSHASVTALVAMVNVAAVLVALPSAGSSAGGDVVAVLGLAALGVFYLAMPRLQRARS